MHRIRVSLLKALIKKNPPFTFNSVNMLQMETSHRDFIYIIIMQTEKKGFTTMHCTIGNKRTDTQKKSRHTDVDKLSIYEPV